MPFVPVDGAQLYYEEAGSGRAILFAHGGGGDLSQWRHQRGEFARTHRVVLYDARGHGRSRAERLDFGIADFAADIAHLLRHLGIARAHLVGATLGGVAALEFALAHPESVDSLVLVSTAPDTTDEMRERFEASAAVVESGDLVAFAEGFLHFLFTPAYAEAHAEEVADFRRGLEQIDPASYARSIRALGHRPDLTPRLGAVQVPVLVVTGELDPIPTSAPGAEALLRALPRARAAVVPHAAHLPQIEQPARFNALVREFLAAAEREATGANAARYNPERGCEDG